jgi:hypothetical protein
VLAELEEDRRGKWDVLMLSRELRSQYSSEVESRMPLQTARTGSERGVRATLERATGPYSTQQETIVDESALQGLSATSGSRFCEETAHQSKLPCGV